MAGARTRTLYVKAPLEVDVSWFEGAAEKESLHGKEAGLMSLSY